MLDRRFRRLFTEPELAEAKLRTEGLL
jgi:hypothetical protein